MFYENFDRICKERGTSPSRACVDAGMKQSRAANWKATKALPKQDELQKLANVLRCDVADFFRGETAPRFHTAEDAIRYSIWQQEQRDYAAARTEMEPSEHRPGVELSDDEEYVIWFMRTLSRIDRHRFLDSLFEMQGNLGLGEPSDEELARVVYGEW